MADQDKNKENETKEPENKRKPHEKHVVGRAHLNNIDLSRHAKHDWKAEHKESLKVLDELRSKLKTAPGDINVRVNFQKLGIAEGDVEVEWVPANDPDLDPLVPVPIIPSIELFGEDAVDGNMTVQELLEYLQEAELIANLAFRGDGPVYIESMEINNFLYPTTSDAEGYTPPPPIPDETLTQWMGNAWMYLKGAYVPGVTVYDPSDETPFDPNDPGHALNLYPEATVDEFTPLTLLESHEEVVDGETITVFEITFSYEFHCFDFIYEEREVDGVKRFVLVIRPMRWVKKK
jgi:hypothetical protein